MDRNVVLTHVMHVDVVTNYSLDKLTDVVGRDHNTAKRSNGIHNYGIHNISIIGIICPIT